MVDKKTEYPKRTRQEMIDFIKKYNSFYTRTEFAGHSDAQVKNIYLSTLDKFDKADTTEKQEQEIRRKDLIEYIQSRDPSYRSKDFSKYSDTELTILKVSIELKRQKK